MTMNRRDFLKFGACACLASSLSDFDLSVYPKAIAEEVVQKRIKEGKVRPSAD